MKEVEKDGTGSTDSVKKKQWTEVYISPKINISAQTLNMALHKNPVMHCDGVVIFLHGSQKKGFFSAQLKKKLMKFALYYLIQCFAFFSII